jgi:probable rRNA maturation factor
MSAGASTLLFQHPSRRIHRRELRAFVVDLAARIAGGEVTCVVTTDAELRALNRKFRGRDYAADVLSFPAKPLPVVAARNRRSASTAVHRAAAIRSGRATTGEIAISLDRAAEQAAELGHGVEEELRILILHGLLHLAGLDHEIDGGEMARAEMRWRKRLGLPEGLIERTDGHAKP